MTDVDEYYRPPTAAAEPPTVDEDDALRSAAERVVFASIGQRVGARLLDSLAAFAVGFAVGGANGLLSRFSNHPLPAVKLSPGPFVIGAVASLLYHAFSESIGGASLGKWACGIRVRHELLGKCSFGAALGRNLGLYVDYFFCGLIGLNAISSSPSRQRCGDRWAHTVVIVAKSVPPLRSTNLQNGLVLGVAALAAGDVLAALGRWL